MTIRARFKSFNVEANKLANSFTKFSKNYSLSWRISTIDSLIISELKLDSVADLNELIRRIKHFKDIDFEWDLIEDVDHDH